MKIYSNIETLKQLHIFKQLDHPVAITAPLIYSESVLIGVYCELEGYFCVNVSVQEFQDLKHFFYDAKWFKLLVHGIKRMWQEFRIGGWDTWTDGIADTEMMAYLLDSGREGSEYSLSSLAHRYLDITYPHRAVEIADKGFPEALYEILTDDAWLIAALAWVLLDKMDDDLKFAYFYAELPVAMILNDMTRHGIPVDGQAAAESYRTTLAKMKLLSAEILEGQEGSLWDGSQIYKLLKDRRAVMPAASAHFLQEVSQEDLKVMARSNPIAAKILEWRDLHADLAFLKAAAGQSRIHPTWNMITKTSRITASNPAVQNVSRHTCRPLMKPGPGWVMIKADYKQVQMRILANISKDPALVTAFRQGHDVHWLTVEMCGIHGATDREKRDKAKAVNFGILFQMTAEGLHHELGIDKKTAQGYINAFWLRYSVARQFLNGIVNDLKSQPPEDRAVKSYLGRMRRFDGAFGPREQRQAKATLLQQMEAEILRMALMRLQTTFRKEGMKSRVVITIHDAVYVEAPLEEADKAKRLMKSHMEAAVEMSLVPFEVDIE